MKFGNEGTAQAAHSRRKFAHEFRVTIQNTIGDFLRKMIMRLANALPAFKLPQKFSDLPTLFGGHCLDFIHDLSCRQHPILHKIRKGTSRYLYCGKHPLPSPTIPYFAAGGVSLTQRKPSQ